MKIELKQLELRNFKGAKDQTVEFTNQTDVLGANATGKTRLFDAFTWLLFGKDSEDRKDFSVKALDTWGKPLHQADHSVRATLVVDDRQVTLERTYREKWVKARGEENREFSGHETTFMVNDVPNSQKEFQQRVDGIIPERTFKLLTNPFYFNSMLKWSERRGILFDLAGEIRDEDVAGAAPEYQGLLNMLDGSTLELFRKEQAVRRKLLKESLSEIQPRMDEVQRAILPDPDYKIIEKRIQILAGQIEDIESLIADRARQRDQANQENTSRQEDIYKLRAAMQQREFDRRNEYEKSVSDARLRRVELERAIHIYDDQIRTCGADITKARSRILLLQEQNDSLRQKWAEMNESTLIFDEREFTCPACQRPFESDDIEAKKAEMTANFNRDKAERLKGITRTGQINKAEIGQLEKEQESIQKLVAGRQEGIASNQAEIEKITIPDPPADAGDSEIKKIQEQIASLEKAMTPVSAEETSNLPEQRKKITGELDELKKQLATKEYNEKARERMDELASRQKELSQQIANVEKIEYMAENFMKKKAEMVEQNVNGLFKLVRFRMFDSLINGGIEETCEALIDGVPFPDANNGAKIQAGLDIIRTLSGHYDCYAPVFIDNRESVTEIPGMECQVINLYVDPREKELKVITK